jgi:membrane-bound lytic murein transglycosylase D
MAKGCRSARLLRALGPVLGAAALASCGSPTVNRGGADPENLDPLAEATALDALAGSGSDTVAVAEEGTDFGGLELQFPELVVIDDAYRETLEALWSDDLDAAEAGLAFLDSSLAEVNGERHPLAAIYFESLATRTERLSALVEEARALEVTLARIDSLDMIPEGAADSTALTTQPIPHDPLDPRYDFELVENQLTARWVRYFSGDGRHYMQLWIDRKPLYEEIIYGILDEYKLPRDMIYLAMIESGLSLKARSYANAVGPWQFIASTGRLYGLKIDWWVDDRRHLEKATRAAASHLSDLYESLGSWPLAFAAYNCGVRRVERAIRRHGTRDFWRLTSLPRQTRNYVPKFMAALQIGKDPAAYAFTVPSSVRLEYDLVRVEDATDLHLIAELADVQFEQIVELNPHLKRWSTPPGEAHEVKVPKGKGEETTLKLAQVPEQDRVRWRRHRVRSGETLTSIAQAYGTTAKTIQQANHMSRNTIHPGTYLLIPVVDGESATAQRHIAAAAEVTAGEATQHYRVRRGDTLSRIASRHGVSVRQIMSWNEKRSTRIGVGEILVLHAPEGDGSGAAAGQRITYVVQSGDTLSRIARLHRVSVSQLMSWNKKNSTRIRVGEHLRIYVMG